MRSKLNERLSLMWFASARVCSCRRAQALNASCAGQVKLWDVASQQPSIVASAADLNVGAIFTAGFCGEASWLIAAGGSKGAVAVWDIATSPAVQAKYGRALAAARQGPQLPQPAAGGAVTS